MGLASLPARRKLNEIMQFERAHFKQCVVQKNVTLGGSIVDNHTPVSIPTSKYNDFLFAPICEEADGMPLSVLSCPH
jgi:hypothetical protein